MLDSIETQEKMTGEAPAVGAHPRIERYFATLNQGEFAATAALFAEDGAMLPPFEAPIVGQGAIYAYLEQEARDLQALPKTWETTSLPADKIEVVVRGRVRTLCFAVNVAWTFQLNNRDEIEQVEIKLLASLQELLNLRP